jgi:hypothetical protein
VTVGEYHRALGDRLHRVLGPQLRGVYAAGSFALGDFDPAASDLDVAAVCAGPLPARTKRAVVEALRQESLPCPARGLELVLYPQATVRVPTVEAGFLLNLNTGPRMDLRVDLDPSSVERHWFPIDRAIVRAAGIALVGPPAQELFAEIPRRLLVPVVRESLEWHLAAGVAADRDSVLNACRAARWLLDDVWSSKPAAGAWALERLERPEIVAAALAADRAAMLDAAAVERHVRDVLALSRSRKL